MNFLTFINGKKTYILGTLAILTSLVGVATGSMTLQQFLSSQDVVTVLVSLLGITIRHGVSTSAIAIAEQIAKIAVANTPAAPIVNTVVQDLQTPGV
jgi:hypothetical protein